MGRDRKRKRSRSNTPPVEWETLLVPQGPPVSPLGVPTSAAEAQPTGSPDAGAAATQQAGSSRQSTGDEKARGAASRVGLQEKEAWRLLVLRLAALRGDPEMDRHLAEKHPELQRVAEDTGATGSPAHSIEQAREACKAWFERGLKGSNRHGPDQRAALCTRLMQTLQARGAALLADAQAAGGSLEQKAADVLKRAKAEEEGPLICALIGREVEGSRYEGIWVSRSGPGRYIIGDEDLASGLPDKDADGANIDRVIRVAIRIVDGKLTVDGFFHKGEDDMNPVKCQVGPFLTVYFEGLSLKEALSKWKEGLDRRAKIAAAGGTARFLSATNSQIKTPLPPGWEKRESRSKKGVFYYVNEAKGLTQFERP